MAENRDEGTGKNFRSSLFTFLVFLMMTWTFLSPRPGYVSKPRVARILLVLGVVSGVGAAASGIWCVSVLVRKRNDK